MKSEVSRNPKTSVRSIAITAMLLAVLIAQEYLLIGIPNVQLTATLIMIYAFFLKNEELYPMVIGYVVLDNVLTPMGGFNPIYLMPMLIAWLLLAYVSKALKHKPTHLKFIWIVGFGFIYGWIFLPFRAIEMSFTISQMFRYLWFDLTFEAIMAA